MKIVYETCDMFPGFVCGVCIGWVVSKTKAFRFFIKASALLSALAVLLFLSMIYSNNYVGLVLSLGFLGKFPVI
jgi:hypothetical protein